MNMLMLKRSPHIPAVDATASKVSEGDIKDIRYQLVQDNTETDFCVDSATGNISGSFREHGNFSMKLEAADQGGRVALVQVYKFQGVGPKVDPRLPHSIHTAHDHYESCTNGEQNNGSRRG